MSRPETAFHHGDEVLVFDANDQYVGRGTVRGINRTTPPHYDIMPAGAKSYSDATIAFRQVPENRLRRVGKMYIAYEQRKEAEAQHVLDDA